VLPVNGFKRREVPPVLNCAAESCASPPPVTYLDDFTEVIPPTPFTESTLTIRSCSGVDPPKIFPGIIILSVVLYPIPGFVNTTVPETVPVLFKERTAVAIPTYPITVAPTATPVPVAV